MSHSLRVLLVEDNPGDADLIKEMLPRDESTQYDIECVARLSVALECVVTDRFDIILLDLGLPDSYGLDTLHAMRRKAVKLPIIVLTGNNDEQTGLNAIREGAQDYLVKGQINKKLLARSIEYALERMNAENTIKKLNESLEQRIVERTAQLTYANETLKIEIVERKRVEEALNKLNEELERLVAERTLELREKDQMLLVQGRQAAMGEMIENIAHQWRQPLNNLGLTIQQLSLIDNPDELTTEFLDDYVNSSMELIQHMSKTINDFRNYFRPDKEMIEFKVRETIDNTLSLLEGSLQNSKIRIEIIEKDNPVINGYQNEFVQVLINILSNARDALIEKEICDPMVTITTYNEDGCAVVLIADNAGGIPEEILDKIFDPYFTTKGPQQGTGVGLFMSKAIIEKNMGGRLAVRNTDNGAEFRIEV